jgi:hypothetical protein
LLPTYPRNAMIETNVLKTKSTTLAPCTELICSGSVSDFVIMSELLAMIKVPRVRKHTPK